MNNSIFQLNENFFIKRQIFEQSVIYIIDNFYKYPEKVLNFFLNTEPEIHKSNEKPSYNQIYFDDRRHTIESHSIVHVYDFLEKLCKQKSSPKNNIINTNLTRFRKSSFNDYKNNYWWPHKDSGYNSIIYLNKNDEHCGTNLYLNLNPKEEPPKGPEHFYPWRSKYNYKLIKRLNPKFNRMVMFDGLKFCHGMNICNDFYFGEEYRINQVFFFEPNQTKNIYFKYH
jgi:hypothetical protein